MNAAGQRLADPVQQPEPAAAPRNEGAADSARTSSRPRIILIEDSSSDAYLVRLSLDRARLSADLTHFSDSATALQWFAGIGKGEMPDLLILDLNIPRQDGFEILAALKKMPQLHPLTVMILTSSISPEDRRRASAAGVRRFLSKPMMLDDFLRDVATAVMELLGESAGECAQ